MNIVQAYNKFKGQCIILISGFSGSGKARISKFIVELFKFQYVNLSQFYYSKETFDHDENYVTLKDGSKILNWDNIYDSVDWDKFNEFVNSVKSKGVVVVGFGFPNKLLKFEPDFHIQIKINKQNLFTKMEENCKKLDSKCANDNIDIAKNIFNNITYPMQQKINNESKINKYINTNDMSEEKIKEEIFKYLMDMINKWLRDHSSDITTLQEGNSNNSNNINKQNNKKIHYEHNTNAYDKFYYPNKKKILYDFNDEGIDYPGISQTTSSTSDDDDTIYLFTRNGREDMDL
jgi:broad-specificity NMP kinase